MSDRESVKCPLCGSEPGTACTFPDGPAPIVDADGTRRRVVHAGRYAETLPEEERAQFWENAVQKYMETELALIANKEATT